MLQPTDRTEHAFQYRAPGKDWTNPMPCSREEAEQIVSSFAITYPKDSGAESRVLVRKVITLPWQPLTEDLD